MEGLKTTTRKTRRRGQALVEFALVIPLMLLLFLGIIEFGRMIFTYASTIAAAREGARYGVATREESFGLPKYMDCAGIRDAVKRIGYFAGIEDGDITIQYINDSGIFASSCPPSQPVHLGDSIVIGVSSHFSSVVPNIPDIPFSSASTRMIVTEIEVGESRTGAGSPTGAATDVYFKTTTQSAEESKGFLTVEVVINEPQVDPVTIPFTVSGTAVVGSDYNVSSSPITIPAGGQQAFISIYLANDGIAEGEEEIILMLGVPTNATLGPQNTHTITVQDPPLVSFSTASNTWPEDAGSKIIQIELSKTSSQNVSVDIGIGGDAEWGDYKDYSTSAIPVVIPAGSLSANFIVTINDDYFDEGTETAIFTLTNPVNAGLGAGKTFSMGIMDNDNNPDVSFFTESHIVSEEVLNLTTSVYLTSVSGKEISVPFSIEYLTATSSDIIVDTASPLIIPPGSDTGSISFQILEGDGYEEDESFIIKLGTPSNAGLGSITSQTITIVEAVGNAPYISFTEIGQSATEGVNDTLRIGLEMDHAWKYAVTIYFSVSGSAGVGYYGDYTISSSPIYNAQGKIREDIFIQLQDDLISEAEETIIVTIDSVTNGAVGAVNQHTVTITDNEPLPEVSFQDLDQNVLENGGSIYVPVELSGLSQQEITIPVTISGTALNNSDYSTLTTDLVIAPLSNLGTFKVDILDDAIYDPDETIILSLGTPVNGVLGTITEHTLTILDNELSPCDPKTVFFTVGTNYLSWTMNNAGEDLTITGGKVIWPERIYGSGSPVLNTISFESTDIFSGNVVPGAYDFTASELFPQISSADITYQFDSDLGQGDHYFSVDFRNPATGSTCSLSFNYYNP